MMPVTFAAIGEGVVVGIVALGVEHPTRSPVLCRTFPPQIGHVTAKRCSSRPVPYDARFDGNVARPVGHQPRSRDARGPAATESTTAAAALGLTLQSTGLLG